MTLYRWFICMVAVMTLVACNEEEEIQKWIDSVDQLRTQVQEAMDKTPYQQEQQIKFKNYFGEIEQKALSLKDDEKVVKFFNEFVAKRDLGAICSKLFIAKIDWQKIMKGCTQNRFFLCAEEVRGYPDIVLAIRSRLIPDQQKRFDEIPACRDII